MEVCCENSLLQYGIYSLCHVRHWNSSRLLLALPDSTQGPKSRVRLTRFTGPPKFSAIIKWIYNIVGENVRNFSSGSELSVWMHRSCAVADVCFLLVSTLTLPPFFLSALSIKFSGRVKFATSTVEAAVAYGIPIASLTTTPAPHSVTVNRGVHPRPQTRTPSPNSRRGIPARYWMMAPQGSVEYGGSPESPWLGSRLTYKSLYSLLRWFVPDMNDMFIFSLAVTNLCVVASLFDLRASPIQAVLHFTWTLVKYNFILLVFWLLIISVCNRSLVISMINTMLSLWRRFSLTSLGRLWLDDLRYLALHTYFTIASFFTFAGTVYFFRRRYWPQTLEEPEPLSEYFRFPFRPVIVFNPGRPTLYYSRNPQATLNPRIRNLIRQVGLDEYQIVQHGSDYEYMLNLPVWRHTTQNAPKSLLCVRCRLVKALKMKKMKQKLKLKPCRRCGFNGNLQDCRNLPTNNLLLSNSETNDNPQQNCRAVDLCQCAICLDTVHIGDVVCGLPCSHVYHQSCIISWLFTDPAQTCPCCRCPAYVNNKHTL